jgi:PAS domain S-box-containing protein
MLIAGIIMVSYFLYVILERNTGLVQLGLISFVAVAQFLPGMAGVLFWQRATRAGFLAGLSGGAVIWYFSLIDPLLASSAVFEMHFDLQAFLQQSQQNIWAFSTFCSLSVNTLLFVTVSLISQQDSNERRAVAACFQDNPFIPDNYTAAASPHQLIEQLAGVIGASTGRNEVEKALADLDLTLDEHRPHELRRLRERIERNLSGMLGPMLARMIIESSPDHTTGASHMLADHIRFIEERLEQSRNRLYGLAAELDGLHRYHRQILQDLPLGTCSLSTDGEILNWNQAMEQLSSIDRHHAVGIHVRELPPPWGELISNFLSGDQEHLHKIRVPVHERVRWFNLHKSAIASAVQQRESEKTTLWGGVVILVEDLTDLQTLEAELAHSERLASIGRLAAGVAHEIGNPVTGIACIAQNLQYEEEPAVIEENLADILQQTERISAIVQSLVTFSHSGLPEDRAITRFKLHACVEEAQRLVRLSHHAKQLLYLNLCPQDLVVEGDRQKLLQVFVNLLSNASHASEPGSSIEVDAFSEDNYIMIRVSDQGTGIPEELRDRVFEPFFTTKNPGEGTGLGLPLVYSIIRDHAGSINIDSNPGDGTRMLIRLPLPRWTADQTVSGATPDHIV